METSELESAKELIRKQYEQDVQNCIKEIVEAEKAILEKYGCVKSIRGHFENNQIFPEIVYTKTM